MRALLGAAFDLAPAKVFVAEDMWIAYLSYFALGEGILIYSGTGSIGYYLSAEKDVIRVGGRGNLIDDGGSGFWIAREALKAILRAEEENPGQGWSTILGTCMAAAAGRDRLERGAGVRLWRRSRQDRRTRPGRRGSSREGRRDRRGHPSRRRIANSRASPMRCSSVLDRGRWRSSAARSVFTR